MRNLIIFILIIAPYGTMANDSINLQEIYQRIDNECLRTAEAEIQEYQFKVKRKFTRYLPTLNFRNDSSGIRPALGFNFSSLYRLAEDKQKKEAKIRSIQMKYLLIAEKKRQAVREKYEEYLLQIERVEQFEIYVSAEKELLEIEEQLFKIQESKYRNNKILPSEYLKSKQKFLKAKSNQRGKEFELYLMKNELEKLRKYFYFGVT